MGVFCCIFDYAAEAEISATPKLIDISEEDHMFDLVLVEVLILVNLLFTPWHLCVLRMPN